MSSSEQIRESIEARLRELRSEITSLQAARAALDPDGASRTRSRSRTGPTGAGATRPERGRSPEPDTPSRQPRARPQSRPPAGDKRPPVEVLFSGKLEAMLRDAPDGLNAAAIATAANARPAQVRALLRELQRTGQVRRTGVGTGSRWRLITEEERIAERAAELEARSTSKP